GIDVHKTRPTYKSQLTALFEPAADGTGTITVRNVGSMPETGTVYLGGKAHTYSAIVGTTQFTVSEAEAYNPFTAATNHYGRPHLVSAGKDFAVGINSWLQDAPRTWINRRVALYCHRI